MMELTRYEFESMVTPSTDENVTLRTGDNYQEMPGCQLMLHEISYEHTSTHMASIQVITKCLADMEK